MEDQDCDNLKSINTSIGGCLQILQTSVNEQNELTPSIARDVVVTSKALLTSVMDLFKGVINKTEPPAPQPGNATGRQCSIDIKSKKLSILFEDAVNVLRSLQQDAPSTGTRLSEDDVEKIVQRALTASARGSISSRSNTEKRR